MVHITLHYIKYIYGQCLRYRLDVVENNQEFTNLVIVITIKS